MDILLSVLAVLAGIIGIIGSILPGLPGPPVSWVGILLLFIKGDSISLGLLLALAAVTVIVTVIDYIVPATLTKATGGSKYASRGAMVGLIAGCFLTPIGMIVGAFIGAYLFERYWGRKRSGESLKAAGGAFLGFLTGTGIKLIASGIMMWLIIAKL